MLDAIRNFDDAVKGFYETFKDFISMTFNENLMRSLADLHRNLKLVSP